ncbi:MAG: Acetylornithine/succinyldiaminopimelate aminotransferase [Firmicutes bacterium]|nr:Acetylornithine/succinyldiaminopimelate aminotransferase [Bacillota bacterium]
MNKEQIIAMDKQYYMPVFNRNPIVLSHGKGPYVYDNEGNQYLDFLAGIAVNLLGHGHPKLVAAIAEQAGRMIHCSNLYYTEPQALLAKKLAEVSGMDRVFMCNSGAEANEGAMKLARKYAKKVSPGKIDIITAEHCFHGRTLATLTATAQPKYHKGYEPLPEGFKYVPFNDFSAIQAAVNDFTCAIMLEPIQGEGGVNLPEADYLAKVRALCDEKKIVLIFDEIQSGMGRTGTMFACQQYGVQPDIMTAAKGLGGGVPIGAFMATEEVANAFSPGDHGTTFGGNPLVCAAANAVLTAMEEEGILANVQAVGAYMLTSLQQLRDKYPLLIEEVRGKGLIQGIQLSQPGADIVAGCLKKGLIINCTAGNILRFVPSLTITKQHVDEFITILDSVLKGNQ